MFPDLVLLVPSRGRQKQLNAFLESVQQHSTMHTMVYLWLTDDTKIDDKYSDLVRYGTRSDVRCGIHNKWNRMAEQAHWYALADHIMIANDDIVIQTPGFDEKLIKAAKEVGKYALVYPDDGVHHGNVATFPCLTAPFYDILGYIFCNAFNHGSCDVYLQTLALNLDILRYVPEVVFEHKHPVVGKAKMDECYELGLNANLGAKDRDTFQVLLKNHMSHELNRLRYAMDQQG